MTNKILAEYLSVYGHPYAITTSLLQQARSTAKLMIFGSPDDNVKYAYAMVHECRQLGHSFNIEYTDRKGIMKCITSVVIMFEQHRLKAEKKGFTLAEKSAFMKKWKETHYDLMIDVLRFVNGLFFAPSFSQATMPLLQNVIQADACHVTSGSTQCTQRTDLPRRVICSRLHLQLFLEMKTRRGGLNFGNMRSLFIQRSTHQR